MTLDSPALPPPLQPSPRRRKRFKPAGPLALMLLAPLGLAAQESLPPLAEPMALAEDTALQAAIPQALRERRLQLRLPDGTALDAPVSTRFEDGFLHLRSATDGDPARISLVVAGSRVHGAIRLPGTAFRVAHVGGRQRLVPVRAERAAASGPDALAAPRPVGAPLAAASSAPPNAAASDGPRPGIDVLAFLDPRVTSALGANGARASWLANIDVANDTLINSRVANAHFRTVGFAAYAPGIRPLQDMLLTFQPDPAVNAERDRYGADFAALYAPTRFNDSICGIAYLFGVVTNPDGSFGAQSNNAEFSAFSISGTTEAIGSGFECGVLTVVHELGHNLGANHERGNGGGEPYPFSAGDRCGTLDTADVMSSRSFGILDQNAQRIYSTPAVSVQGQPCGVVNVTDNARAVDLSWDASAAYRTPPAMSGTVSATRARIDIAETAGSLSVGFTRDGDLGRAASVEIAAIGDARSANPAQEGRDFGETVTRLSFAAGQASASVQVPIFATAGNQGARSLLVVARYPIGVAVPDGLASRVTITEPAAMQPGRIAFADAAPTVAETVGTATITVTRSGGSDGAVSVGYTASAGSASAGVDFVATSGRLAWAAGDTTAKTFTVAILDDTEVEADETVRLALAAPEGGAELAVPSDATLTIRSDDVAPPPPPPPPTTTGGSSGGGSGGGTGGSSGGGTGGSTGGTSTGGAALAPEGGGGAFGLDALLLLGALLAARRRRVRDRG